MPDRILTATSSDGQFSVAAGVTTELVRESQRRHGLAPTASAAVGRLVTGGVLLGTALKGKERLSLQVASRGPLAGLTADIAFIDPETLGARAYARNPTADVPLNAHGKFDVAAAVGAGHLQVTRSFEVGQPYVGVVPLASGEIGDDIAAISPSPNKFRRWSPSACWPTPAASKPPAESWRRCCRGRTKRPCSLWKSGRERWPR